MTILLNNGTAPSNLSMEEIKNQIGWLEHYRGDIETWHQYSQIARIASDWVRMEGTHPSIVDSFEQAIAHVKISFKGLQFADRLSMFLKEQTNGMKPGDCFIGSTEVIESLFGKIKYMEQSKQLLGSHRSYLLELLALVQPMMRQFPRQ